MEHNPPWAQALIVCGGDINLSECAQFPFSAWNKAHDAGELRSYWPWVWEQAKAAGIAVTALVESAASYRRRTQKLPGAVSLR